MSATGDGAMPTRRSVRVTWDRIRWMLRQRFVLDGSQLPKLDEGDDRKLRWYARTRRGRWMPVSVADAIELADEHASMVVLRSRLAVERGEAARDVAVGLELIEPALGMAARRLLDAMADHLAAARVCAEELMPYVAHTSTDARSDPLFAEVVHELHREIGEVAAFAASYRERLDSARSAHDDPPH
jgi:hypothetical protein